MSKQINQAKAQLAKLKGADAKKAKTIIQAIQQKIDESAKKTATQNAEHQKRKQELEIGKKLAVEKYQKKIGQLEEKYQKENAELESKNWERNANFAKEMASLKEQLKERVNWDQVYLVMLAISPIASAKGNCWDSANTKYSSISISADGLNATSNATGWRSVSAEKGFHISDSTGPVLYYFEVTKMSSSYQHIHVGLSSDYIPGGSVIGRLPNSYAIHYGDGHDHCWLSGKAYPFEWPNGAIEPEWNGRGDVVGCGLLWNPEKELSIFFTVNGLLIGRQMPISSMVDPLYPTVSIFGFGNVSVEANFGDNPANPFKYDIKKCPGMVFN